MMMIKRALPASLLAVAASLPAVVAAQAPAPPPHDSLFFVTGGPSLKLDVLGGEGVVPGGVVKDKPYTADSITESTQVLADGNRITRRNESRFYRDSQGRTRREQTMSALGVFQSANDPVTMITINDPVAEATYFLDPVAHTARKLQPFRLALGDAAKTFERPVPPPGAVGETLTVVHAGAAGSGPVSLQAGEPGGPAGVGISIRGPGNAAFGPGPALEPFVPTEATTEDLGRQVLEGVLAHGTRETATIPAGAIGNERPIEITSERWYSDELEAVVLSRTSDPRFGETSYRLVNVARGEPSADLFAVPQGYELQSEPHAGVRMFGQGEPPPAGARVERRAFIIEQSPPQAQK